MYTFLGRIPLTRACLPVRLRPEATRAHQGNGRPRRLSHPGHDHLTIACIRNDLHGSWDGLRRERCEARMA
jgi:hypothetical protein